MVGSKAGRPLKIVHLVLGETLGDVLLEQRADIPGSLSDFWQRDFGRRGHGTAVDVAMVKPRQIHGGLAQRLDRRAAGGGDDSPRLVALDDQRTMPEGGRQLGSALASGSRSDYHQFIVSGHLSAPFPPGRSYDTPKAEASSCPTTGVMKNRGNLDSGEWQQTGAMEA